MITLISLTQDVEPGAVYLSAGWWVAAALIGVWLGRRAEANPPITRLLAGARAERSLPEQRPGLTVVNRLWPLLLSTFTAGVLGFIAPQVAAVAAGFAIIWALALAAPGTRRSRRSRSATACASTSRRRRRCSRCSSCARRASAARSCRSASV